MTLDVAATGQLAGMMFGQALLDLVDGKPPLTWPVAGIGRSRNHDKFQMVTFQDGMTEAVSRWLRDPELVDAALISHRSQLDIDVMLAICEGTDRLDVILQFAVAVHSVTGRPVTTLPVYDTRGERTLVEEFLAQLHCGMTQHERASELEGAIGAMGSSQQMRRLMQ